MSEPLSREELENRSGRYLISFHVFADTALHYLDRVAELEKEQDELTGRLQEVEHPFDASEFKALHDRALSAEEQLKEALLLLWKAHHDA